MRGIKARGAGGGGSSSTVAGPQADATTLTNTTATSPSGSGQWGSEQLTFSGLTGTVQVFAELAGHRRGGSTGVRPSIRVSFDGGSTWTSGPDQLTTKQSLGTTDRVPVSNLLYASDDPSGDVVVQARWTTDGTTGNAELEAGYLRAMVFGEPAEVIDGGTFADAGTGTVDGGTL